MKILRTISNPINLYAFVIGTAITAGGIACVVFGKTFVELITKSTPQTKIEIDSRPIIVDKLSQSTELITTRIHSQTVVPIEKNSTLWGVTVGKSSLLYVASGSVLFGVDLHSLTPDDITVNPDTQSVSIQVPPVVILEASLITDKSKVYQAQSDGFVLNSIDTLIELQDRAEDQALHGVVESACESVGTANQQAKLAITQLVQSITGYPNVEVVFKQESSQSDQVNQSSQVTQEDYQTCDSIKSNPNSAPQQ